MRNTERKSRSAVRRVAIAICACAGFFALAGCAPGASSSSGADPFEVLHVVQASEADPKETFEELIADSSLVVYGRIDAVSVEYGEITQPAAEEAPDFVLQTRIVRFVVQPEGGGKPIAVRFWSQISPDLVEADKASFEKEFSITKTPMLFALQSDPSGSEFFCTSLDSSLCPLVLENDEWKSARNPDSMVFPQVGQRSGLEEAVRIARESGVDLKGLGS